MAVRALPLGAKVNVIDAGRFSELLRKSPPAPVPLAGAGAGIGSSSNVSVAPADSVITSCVTLNSPLIVTLPWLNATPAKASAGAAGTKALTTSQSEPAPSVPVTVGAVGWTSGRSICNMQSGALVGARTTANVLRTLIRSTKRCAPAASRNGP